MQDKSAQVIERAVAAICPDIRCRIESRAHDRLSERQLWWELSCGVLSSQVPFELAVAAANRIDETGVLYQSPGDDFTFLRQFLQHLLVEPLLCANSYRRYRFPSLRAEQLARARLAVDDQGDSLGAVLAAEGDAEAMRRWLVQNIPGLGPKQASMFLRNIGVSYDLAVIDRHVLSYMGLMGLCRATPNAVAKLPAYRRHELMLRRHADNLGYQVGLLDWAIWIVMRMADEVRITGVSM